MAFPTGLWIYLAAALAAGQAGDGRRNPTTGAPRGDRRAVTDGDIVLAVDTRLFHNPAVAAHRIDVSARDGVVTLTGTVDNLLAEGKALDVARDTRGVRAVIDRITVDRGARADDEIARDVKAALADDAATDAYEVDVRVENGVVSLLGKVDSWPEFFLAGEVAGGVKGVTEVRNLVRVEPKAQRPDAEIEADVRRRLESDVRVDDNLIAVEVSGGAVTLKGVVGSAAEHARAYRDAWVAGVKSVDASGLKVDRWWARNELRRPASNVVVPDAAIERAVRDAFTHDPRVFSFNPSVLVTDGVVTLMGTVDNLRAKWAAGDDAANVHGVRRVVNLLKVRPAKPPGDAEVAAAVRAALRRDPVIGDYDVKVAVRNGRAYLSGEADSRFERTRAAGIASRVSGVTEVYNRLRVEGPTEYWSARPGPSRADEGLRQAVVDELWWSPFVDASEVMVSVRGGTATLTGTVDSPDEVRAAGENAYEAGALRVINRLKVEDKPGGP